MDRREAEDGEEASSSRYMRPLSYVVLSLMDASMSSRSLGMEAVDHLFLDSPCSS